MRRKRKTPRVRSRQRRKTSRTQSLTAEKIRRSEAQRTSSATRVAAPSNSPIPGNLSELVQIVKARPSALSDPCVQEMLAEAFARGARLIPPGKRRGRPKRLEGIRHEEDPRIDRVSDDLAILGAYEEVLAVLRKAPVKRQKDEEFERWIDRLMYMTEKAWDHLAHVVEMDAPSLEHHGKWLNRPVRYRLISLAGSRLRVLVKTAVSRMHRRDSIRCRIAYGLVAERWNLHPGPIWSADPSVSATFTPDLIRSRVQAARKIDTT